MSRADEVEAALDAYRDAIREGEIGRRPMMIGGLSETDGMTLVLAIDRAKQALRDLCRPPVIDNAMIERFWRAWLVDSTQPLWTYPTTRIRAGLRAALGEPGGDAG